MKKIFLPILFIFITSFLVINTSYAVKYYAKGTPTRAMQDLDDKLEKFHIGRKLTKEQKKENQDLKREIIKGTFDIRELSKLALSSHWKTISIKEQDHFVDLLTSILETKALFSKEQLATKTKSAKKYNVVYRGHDFLDKEKKKSLVKTKVIIPAENITVTLNYKLKKVDNEWKIFDVIVDEASLAANYRYQFNSIITKHGYPDLVRRMTNKLDEINKDRDSSLQDH